MIMSKKLFSASVTLSIVIAFTFLSRVHAEEVKREDGVKKHKEIEGNDVAAGKDVAVDDVAAGKDVAVRTKTLKKSHFKISESKITSLGYHQSENKKFKLHALIHVVEEGTESEEMSLSGLSTSTLPRAFSLSQNYPNPFNPTTTITFDVPGELGEEKQVRLNIYDIRGRKVRTLVDSEFEPGNHRAIWDGKNDRGQRVASGVYLYTLRSEDKIYIRKMVAVK